MIHNNLFTDVLITDHNHYNNRKLKTRNMTFDFVRGLAVIFMVLVHVMGVYSNSTVQDSFFYDFIDFLGSPPAAPVFMFTMGVFFMLSSKSASLKVGIKRGVKLLLLGCLLSFLREDLLILLEGNLTHINFFSNHNLITLWEVDILQFAGLAYILMSLIKSWFKRPIWWLIIALVIMIVSPVLWGITSDIKILDWIFNNLWGSREIVYFPIFGWLFYPLIGMIFGLMMKASSDIDALFNSLLKPGLVLLVLGSIITATNFNFHIGDYFRSGPGSMIWITGFVFTWIWLMDKLIKKVKDNNIFNTIYYWGKETTSIYIIHWLIISWGTIILGYETAGYLGTILLMAFVSITTHYLSKPIKIRI